MSLQRTVATSLALLVSCLAHAESDRSSALTVLQARVPALAWDNSTAITVDINADGVQDTAMLGFSEHTAAVGVVLGPPTADAKVFHLDFPFEGDAQLGTCGRPTGLRTHPTSEVPLEALGAYPDGYRICPRCVELEVAAGECDPLVVFWNYKASILGWWRA